MSKKLVVDVQENVWVEDQARLWARETLRMIVASAKAHKITTSKKIVLRFISCFIEELLIGIFHEKSEEGTSRSEHYNNISKNFRSLKQDLQDHISAAFQVVVSKATGSFTEFYCEIKREPEMKNKVNH